MPSTQTRQCSQQNEVESLKFILKLRNTCVLLIQLPLLPVITTVMFILCSCLSKITKQSLSLFIFISSNTGFNFRLLVFCQYAPAGLFFLIMLITLYFSIYCFEFALLLILLTSHILNDDHKCNNLIIFKIDVMLRNCRSLPYSHKWTLFKFFLLFFSFLKMLKAAVLIWLG